MKLLKNIKQVMTLEGASRKDGRNLKQEDLGVLNNTCIIYDEKIRYIGNHEDAPGDLLTKDIQTYDLSGFVVTPEIVDSHTHLIFGGNRAKEYSMRLNGEDYQKIAEDGGGILESSRGTNSISDNDLLSLCSERIERICSYGVGTIEIKSGYGLSLESELRVSRLIDKLKKKFHPRVRILNTYMAAHAVPKSYDDSHSYIQEVCLPLLKQLAGENIIDAVDIFHEKGYFTEKYVRALFNESKKLNISVKSHADEFNDNKGAILAVEYNALSTDHLLCTDTDGIDALSKSDTVATLLPGTGFFLGKPQANARKLLDAGAKVAIASDYNPGSCHCDNVLLIASLAAPTYKMNQAELWSAITLNASHALGLKEQGSLEVGKDARFSIFKVNSIDEITYNWGRNLAVELDSIEP